MSPMARRVYASVSVCCALALPIFAAAQPDADTLRIPEVKVFAERFAASTAGVEVERYDLSHAPGSALQSIDHLLEMQSATVLRGYGPGGSFSASLQGGSAAHTQILLNGIPFDNPALAQADLSLLPSFLFSDVGLLTGPSAALLGNASVAGTLFLDQRTGGEGQPWLSQKMAVGSFGELGSGTVWRYGKGALKGQTSLYFREAQNDFDRRLPNGRVEAQPNAAFRTRGVQQVLDYRSKGWTSHALIWVGETDRRIPPILSRTTSQARQHDASMRAQAHAGRSFGRVELSTDLAYDRAQLHFLDQGIDDRSHFTTWHAQAEAKTRISGTEVGLLAFYRRSDAGSDNYSGLEQRHSPALVARGQRSFFGESTRVSAALRAEWLNGSLLPLLPTVGVDQRLAAGWQLKGNFGRVYRLPGLNDLFWNPGGNPDLLPESGWSQELGVYHHRDQEGGVGTFSAKVFSRQVSQWIIWVPGPAYWQPENLRSAWSRGVELRASWVHPFGDLQWAHRAEAQLTRTTTRHSLRENDSSLDRQLIYVPLVSVMAEERFTYRRWSVSATAQYRSERFTTADNSRSLDPYLLVHLQAETSLPFGKNEIRCHLTVRNLLNADYQMVVNRPMPGRHFLLGVEIHLFKQAPDRPGAT